MIEGTWTWDQPLVLDGVEWESLAEYVAVTTVARIRDVIERDGCDDGREAIEAILAAAPQELMDEIREEWQRAARFDRWTRCLARYDA